MARNKKNIEEVKVDGNEEESFIEYTIEDYVAGLLERVGTLESQMSLVMSHEHNSKGDVVVKIR